MAADPPQEAKGPPASTAIASPVPRTVTSPAAMAQAVALQAAVPTSRSSAVSAAPALLSHSLGDATAADRAAAPLVQARPFSSVRPAPLRAARAEARQAIVCAGALPWAAERRQCVVQGAGRRAPPVPLVGRQQRQPQGCSLLLTRLVLCSGHCGDQEPGPGPVERHILPLWLRCRQRAQAVVRCGCGRAGGLLQTQHAHACMLLPGGALRACQAAAAVFVVLRNVWRTAVALQ